MFMDLINTDQILQCCLFQLPCFHWMGTELCASSLLYVLIMANMSEYYLYVAFMGNVLFPVYVWVLCSAFSFSLQCYIQYVVRVCVAILCTTFVILGGRPDKFRFGPYI